MTVMVQPSVPTDGVAFSHDAMTPEQAVVDALAQPIVPG
jgi:hypothetical protein